MQTAENASARDEAWEDGQRDKGRVAFHEGRYRDAFALYHAAILSRAIRWFREEGVTFARPAGEITAVELIVGLAYAANAELHERGEAASNKLSAAAWLLQAAAELRLALEMETELSVDAVSDRLGELALRGVLLGQVDMIMMAIKLGWLDKLAQHEVDRARRSEGAAKTNAKKASVREEALGEALRIAGKNATLSNEEVAVKVRESLRLPTTVGTLTRWVREWRRKGFIAPQTPT